MKVAQIMVCPCSIQEERHAFFSKNCFFLTDNELHSGITKHEVDIAIMMSAPAAPTQVQQVTVSF